MSKAEVSVVEKIKACEKSAMTIANPETRILKDSDIPVGKHIWQGDVALLRLKEVPSNAKLQKGRTMRQVVEGTTRGSRHCVSMESMVDTKFYTASNAGVLSGDIIESSKTIELEHPEHGNIVVPPGSYQIKFQRAYSPLQELKRQRD
jgi:hypothetical protein